MLEFSLDLIMKRQLGKNLLLNLKILKGNKIRCWWGHFRDISSTNVQNLNLKNECDLKSFFLYKTLYF